MVSGCSGFDADLFRASVSVCERISRQPPPAVAEPEQERREEEAAAAEEVVVVGESQQHKLGVCVWTPSWEQWSCVSP
ncbi:hypothetical protein JOB18_013659 [Solea senegalensis]|uniref:Uncharacterized protein n=1 Tax=Solea senegalensis TaxID=28829 RepID=A0AAV6SRP7_SOLSE|nr:hypothetical protein JOB18_013659 [Solea senegalensis]